MGVDCDGCLMYGWQLDYDDIPDLDGHCDKGWHDVFETVDGYVVHDGEKTDLWADEVVIGDNAYQGYGDQAWYVGIPLADDKSASEFILQLDEGLAGFIYQRVTGSEPKDPPKVLCFGRWW